MLEEHFTDIEVLSIYEGADDLGSFTTYYERQGIVKGILTRSSSTERMIAAQKGIEDSYIFMTKPKDNNGIVIDKNTVLRTKFITARVNSSELPGEQTSEEMSEISQWTAKSYELVAGAEVKNK